MSQENKPNAAEDSDRKAAAQARVIQTLGVWALVRTAFSCERSLMSWMRTSVSLYSFGFSLIKFLGFLGGQVSIPLAAGLRQLGLALICIGILVLVLGTVEYARRIRKMRQLGLPRVSRYPLPLTAAAAMALVVVGSVALIGILLNWPV
jgi:putative membrane protein